MPIRDFWFAGAWGRDLHLIWPNPSPPLRPQIYVLPVGSDSGVSLDDHLNAAATANDFTYQFRPTFRAVNLAGAWFNFSIAVDEKTGQVTFPNAGATFPDDIRPNFIIEFQILTNPGGPALTQFLPVRVHVHRSVRALRLTPQTASARLKPDGKTYGKRFALRAEFDDSSVGDLTRHPGVGWSMDAASANWEVESNSTIVVKGGAAGDERTLSASWRYSETAQPVSSNEVKLKVLRPWSQEAGDPKIEFIDGHPSMRQWPIAGPVPDVTARPESMPNVLFVGTGFLQPDDKQSFEDITNKLVLDLRIDKLTSPFDLLATSINYWRILLPATRRGGRQIGSEMLTLIGNRSRQVFPAKRLRKPPPYELSNIVYHIGLPMRAETELPGEKTRAQLRAEWATVLPQDMPALDVKDEVIDAWKRMGNRQFVDAIDGLGLLRHGEAPEVTVVDLKPMLSLEDEAELRGFIKTRSASNGVTLEGAGDNARLGRLWAEDQPTWAFDNQTLLVVIAATKAGLARGGKYIAIPIDDTTNIVPTLPTPNLPTGATRGLIMNYTEKAPSAVSRDFWRTIAHELAHSFDLGDEYSNGRDPYTGVETDITDGNIMSSAIHPNQTGPLDPDKIKWNWLRAKKAAPLIKRIDPRAEPGVVNVDLGEMISVIGMTILPEHAAGFKVGDKAALRTRARHAALTLVGNLDSASATKQMLCTITKISRLQVMADGSMTLSDSSGNAVYIEASLQPPIAAGKLLTFARGSVLFVLADAEAPPQGYGPFQRLISKRVFQYMADKKRPLSPHPIDAAKEFENFAAAHMPPSDTYKPEYSVASPPRIVGLYQGAFHHASGAYRPAGYCLMRNTGADVELCHVCRYIMVDMIDPTKHGAIDQDYNHQYPD